MERKCGGVLGGLRRSAIWERILSAVKTDAFVDDAEIDELIFGGIPDDADRFESLLDAHDLLFEELAQLDDTFIADTEMLSGAVVK